MRRRKHVEWLITTGGTIASRPGANGGVSAGRGDSGAQLVAALQDAGSQSVEVVDLPRQAPSPSPTATCGLSGESRFPRPTAPKDKSGVSSRHRGHRHLGGDGVYAWPSSTTTSPPVVLTGARRPPGHPAPDGPANLKHAVAVAWPGSSHGAEVL